MVSYWNWVKPDALHHFLAVSVFDRSRVQETFSLILRRSLRAVVAFEVKFPEQKETHLNQSKFQISYFRLGVHSTHITKQIYFSQCFNLKRSKSKIKSHLTTKMRNLVSVTQKQILTVTTTFSDFAAFEKPDM